MAGAGNPAETSCFANLTAGVVRQIYYLLMYFLVPGAQTAYHNLETKQFHSQLNIADSRGDG